MARPRDRQPEYGVSAANLDDLTHGFVSHDVARMHVRHEPSIKMKIGAADSSSSP